MEDAGNKKMMGETVKPAKPAGSDVAKIVSLRRPQKATPHVPAHQKEERWLLVDAKDRIVGKVATAVAKILMGKDQPNFNRAVDAKANVVVINADKVRFSGQKLDKKKYIRHTGYPKGLRETTPARIFAGKYPQRVVMQAISGMLPKNRLGKVMLSRLYVYAGEQHPHAGQNPKETKLF